MSEMDKIKKSRSMTSLEQASHVLHTSKHKYRKENMNNERRVQSRSISESSVEVYVVVDSESEGDERKLCDSGIADRSTVEGDMMLVLEQKMDKLNDMFQEQCRLLSTLKEEIRNSRTAMEKAEEAQHEALDDLIKKVVTERYKPDSGFKNMSQLDSTTSDTNTRAKSLLDAIELRHGFSLDKEIRESLISFLQSDELKDHMVATTAQSVKDLIGDCLSRDVSNLYLPILEHSHRRLLRTVTKTLEEAFIELEEKSVSLSQSVYKVTRSMRRSLDRHQHLLDAAAHPTHNLIDTLKHTVQELLHEEMKQWRQKMVVLLSSPAAPAVEFPEPPPVETPPAPVRPANGRSLIDQLMVTAELTKQIEGGGANAAFERALNAGDLSLVTAACRALDRSLDQCTLDQHILLALIQQLSTDMLEDTMLKCRYLEYGIINLDPTNQLTRTHLPLVVGEVRKNLANFRSAYPSHAANRRVALIIMAAKHQQSKISAFK